MKLAKINVEWEMFFLNSVISWVPDGKLWQAECARRPPVDIHCSRITVSVSIAAVGRVARIVNRSDMNWKWKLRLKNSSMADGLSSWCKKCYDWQRIPPTTVTKKGNVHLHILIVWPEKCGRIFQLKQQHTPKEFEHLLPLGQKRVFF